MGLFERIFGSARAATKPLTAPRPDGSAEIMIGDPRFDDWPAVKEFGRLSDARAWRDHLDEAGIEAVLTSDWPLDNFGHGEITLCVPPGSYNEADELLSNYEF